MITKETAQAIAFAYREVETAQTLLAEISEAIAQRTEPDIRDAFGRHMKGLQLGVPAGQNSQRLFDVPWTIARPVIEMHIANQKALISTLTEKALIECIGQPTDAVGGN